jgi:hypothetical protein
MPVAAPVQAEIEKACICASSWMRGASTDDRGTGGIEVVEQVHAQARVAFATTMNSPRVSNCPYLPPAARSFLARSARAARQTSRAQQRLVEPAALHI